MKESLRCEGSGGLRDLILHSDRGVRLQCNAVCLWLSLLIDRMLIDLFCELHTSYSWQLFYVYIDTIFAFYGYFFFFF